MREERKRIFDGKPSAKPKLLFPLVARQDADSSLNQMLKYLANFLFYKFGIEVSPRLSEINFSSKLSWSLSELNLNNPQITLMMLVALVALRMDVVALVYSVWLCVLFVSSRDKQKQIWPLFQWCIVSIILIQYIAFVGITPYFCIG